MASWNDILNPAAAIMGGPAPKAQLDGEQSALMPSAEELAAGIRAFGSDEGVLTPAERISKLLGETAAAMLPTSGFQYGTDVVPHWVPRGLATLLTTYPRAAEQSGFDPYLGMPQRGDERVYMGQETVVRPIADNAATDGLAPKGQMQVDGWSPKDEAAQGKAKRKRKADETLTYEQAINLPYEWDEEEVTAAMKRFRQAGINVQSFDGEGGLLAAWAGLVDRAAMTYSMSKGTRKVTPWDMLELQKRESQAMGAFTDFESGTRTTTATTVMDITEGDAWYALQKTLSNLLGRDPSDQEVRDFSFRMNTLAAKNPTITETITRFQAGEAVHEDRTQTGGFNANDVAQQAYEQAQAAPEYAKVQAGTTYYNALLSAIGAVGDV